MEGPESILTFFCCDIALHGTGYDYGVYNDMQYTVISYNALELKDYSLSAQERLLYAVSTVLKCMTGLAAKFV